jgi:hypothetical protein
MAMRGVLSIRMGDLGSKNCKVGEKRPALRVFEGSPAI